MNSGLDPLSRLGRNMEQFHAVSEKWNLLILLALQDGPLRYGAVHKRVNGISQKMLSQRLVTLHNAGFISRKAYVEIPPRVEYQLTSLGAGIVPHISALVGWIADHGGTSATDSSG